MEYLTQFLTRGNASGKGPRSLERRQAATLAHQVDIFETLCAQRSVIFEIGFCIAQVEFGQTQIGVSVIVETERIARNAVG